MISVPLTRLKARAATTAAFLAMAVGATCAWAETNLPPKAIGDDTWLVMNVNASKVDPESVDKTLRAVLGPQAAMAQQGMADFRAKYKEIIDSGAESMTIVAAGPVSEDKEPNGTAYIKLKPGTDHAAVEKKIRDEQAKNGKADDTEITNEGDYLIMHKKGTALPSGGAAADRVKQFTDALGEGDKAMSVAFVPTADVRAQMKDKMKADPNSPPWAANLGPLLSDAKWMRMTINLGDAPVIGVTVQAANEAGAKGLADVAAGGQKQLTDMATQMQAAGPQGAPMAQTFTALAESLKTTQSGSTVSLDIDAKKVGPAVAQMLPMLMMGRGGPPAPGAPKPGGL